VLETGDRREVFVGRLRQRGERVKLRFGVAYGDSGVLDLFGRAQLAAGDVAHELQLLLVRNEGDTPRHRHGQLAADDEPLNLGCEIQQRQALGDDRGRAQAQLVNDQRRRETLIDQRLIGAGFLDRVHVLALQVFDYRLQLHLCIVDVDDVGLDLRATKQLMRAETAFAGDDHVAHVADGVRVRPQRDRLDQAAFPDRVGQPRDVFLGKRLAWLVRIALDLRKRDHLRHSKKPSPTHQS
jgi:hypothetical protein